MNATEQIIEKRISTIERELAAKRARAGSITPTAAMR